MKYEPGAMALCIDPVLPTQTVTLLAPCTRSIIPAWEVEFPDPVSRRDRMFGSGPIWVVAQRYLMPIRPDADPVETEREIEVTA